MKRMFTKSVGRWAPGAIRDWNMPTWNQLANSAGMQLNEFSVPEVEGMFTERQLQSVIDDTVLPQLRRGPGRPPKEVTHV